jgi:hypothetical protein
LHLYPLEVGLNVIAEHRDFRKGICDFLPKRLDHNSEEPLLVAVERVNVLVDEALSDL